MFLVPLARYVNLIRFSLLSSELIRVLGAYGTGRKRQLRLSSTRVSRVLLRLNTRLLCFMQRKPIQDRPPRKRRLRLSSTRVPSVLLRLNTRLLCSMQRKPIQDRFPRAKKNAKIIAANTFCCSPSLLHAWAWHAPRSWSR